MNMINKYFNFIGWDYINIENESNVLPIDVISNILPKDDHCMNTSDLYKTFIIEQPPKKERAKKETKPKEPKEPKPKAEKKGKVPKAKASQRVIIESNPPRVVLDN